jgi:hypothetical protein
MDDSNSISIRSFGAGERRPRLRSLSADGVPLLASPHPVKGIKIVVAVDLDVF